MCARWELPCTAIGAVTDDGRLRCRCEGEVVGDMPAEALADAPRYPLVARAARDAASSSRCAAGDVPARRRSRARCCCACSPRPTSAPRRGSTSSTTRSSARAPSSAPAATPAWCGSRRRERAIAVALDGDGARVALDPRRGGAEAVAQAALNVACSGRRAGGDHELPQLRQPGAPGHGLRAARGDHRHGRGLRGARHAGRVGQRLALQRERRPADPPDAGRRLRRACSSAPPTPCARRPPTATGALFLLGDAPCRVYDGSRVAGARRRARPPGRIPEVDLPALRRLCDLLVDARARRPAAPRPTTPPTAASPSRWPRSRWPPARGSRSTLEPRGGRRRDALRRVLRPRRRRAARPPTRRAWARPASAAGVPVERIGALGGAAHRAALRRARARAGARRRARGLRGRAAARDGRPSDVRRLRHPRARARRRAAGLLRALRAAAPRPGERRHRRLRRPARAHRQGHGAGRAGLRRGQAAGAAGPRGDRPRPLLDHRLGALDELAADGRPAGPAAPSRSATTATSPTPTSCARSCWSRACGSARPPTPRSSARSSPTTRARSPRAPSHAMERIRGAFSAVVLSEDTLLAFRDPDGIRPLVLGDLDGSPGAWPRRRRRSTSSARTEVRELKPGELLDLRHARASASSQAVRAAPARDDVRVRAHLLRAPGRADGRPDAARRARAHGRAARGRGAGRRRRRDRRCPTRARPRRRATRARRACRSRTA